MNLPKLCAALLLSAIFPSPASAEDSTRALRAGPDFLEPRKLMRAYPQAAMLLEEDTGGTHITINGQRMLFKPGTGCPEPWPDARHDQPLCSSLAQRYPKGHEGRHPPPGFDPGRTRSQALLKLLYGDSPAEVAANCVTVSFLGQEVVFNARHGAAAALERVGRKLEEVSLQSPELRGYLLPVAGAFFWREIEGSHRLSAHSFGIAIDLNVAKGPYWRWAKRDSKTVRDARDNYPQAIVDAFEEEGFVWGGKWHAFDYMHFEYRPELLPAMVQE